MKNIFTEHPHEVGETYFSHCRFAFKLGLNLLVASFAYFTHAVFPFLCQKRGREIVNQTIQTLTDANRIDNQEA